VGFEQDKRGKGFCSALRVFSAKRADFFGAGEIEAIFFDKAERFWYHPLFRAPRAVMSLFGVFKFLRNKQLSLRMVTDYGSKSF